MNNEFSNTRSTLSLKKVAAAGSLTLLIISSLSGCGIERTDTFNPKVTQQAVPEETYQQNKLTPEVICHTEVGRKLNPYSQSLLATTSKSRLEDGAHKIELRTNSSFDETGDLRFFECLIGENGKLISVEEVTPSTE